MFILPSSGDLLRLHCQLVEMIKYAAGIIPVDLLQYFNGNQMGLEWTGVLYLPNPFGFTQCHTGSREIQVKSRLKCQSECHQMEDLAVKSSAEHSLNNLTLFRAIKVTPSLVHRTYWLQCAPR